MSYGGTVLADAPWLHWRLGDASGPAVADASGNDRTGTAQGGVTFAAGGLLRADASRALSMDGVAPTDYPALVLAAAPVAYWPLAETPTGAGTPYADASGHGYDGTLLVGTATSLAGPVAGQTALTLPYSYDGGGHALSDAVVVATTAGLPTDGDAYTLECWVNPAVVADGTSYSVQAQPYALVPLAWGAPGDPQAALLLTQNWHNSGGGTIASDYTGDIQMQSASFFPDVVPAPVWYDGAWHHVVVTYDGSDVVRFYLDGALVSTQSGQGSSGITGGLDQIISLGDAGFLAGDYPGPTQDPYGGALAHCALYRAALSGGQVAAHYAAVAAASAGTMVVQDDTSTLPEAASIEVWMQTTTAQGGVLAQFATADTTQRDLTLYLRADGVPAFRAGDTEIVRSADRTVADGRIHHLVATLDGDAAAWLYVDGSVAAHVEGVTPASPFTGRWQVGAGTTLGLAVPPLSAAYAGTIDEVAIYQD